MPLSSPGNQSLLPPATTKIQHMFTATEAGYSIGLEQAASTEVKRADYQETLGTSTKTLDLRIRITQANDGYNLHGIFDILNAALRVDVVGNVQDAETNALLPRKPVSLTLVALNGGLVMLTVPRTAWYRQTRTAPW